MNGLTEFELACPSCGNGKMIRTGSLEMLVYRRCNECGFRAKYKRVRITDMGSVAALFLNQGQNGSIVHGVAITLEHEQPPS